ncbi:C-type mannose receptor 2-like [Takifugu flavidus]|uniref:C-type mannose receptor 2-like n=1 Tax=Takifugu flavidus TaxID=433684 RepID=UPI0025444BDA|nr:C-type mannose receptor 2-like [Takifugu flavidus]
MDDGKMLLIVCLMLMVTVEIRAETKSFLLLVEKMSWDAAQELCSQRGGDLASISDELQHSMIYNMTNDMNISFWIGLRDDVNSWRWSLNTSSHFVLRWEQSEPDNANSSEHCASISDIGSWRDRDCSVQMPFFCDDGVLVNLEKSWSEALAHCRTLSTDLSAVLLSTTNQILADELKDRHLQEAWIGLYRVSWKWVDSTTSSFRPWAPNEPDNKNNAEGCVAMSGEHWYDRTCNLEMSVLCQQKGSEPPEPADQEPQAQSQIFLKTKLRTECDLTHPDSRAHLSQQYTAALRQRGFSDVNVTIRNVKKQPNK